MLSFHQILVRLLFAAGMGALIGVERDIRRRPAGIRTSMFVCLATALFTILSQRLALMWGDTSGTRIASHIVQGIGFLGAGAILKESGSLVGMTTAATIFVEAAIGMACGGGLFGIAGSSTAIVLFGLFVGGWFIERIGLKTRCVQFRFTTSHADNVARELADLLGGLKITVLQFRTSMMGANSVVEFEAEVTRPQELKILDQLNREGVVIELLPQNGPHE